MHFRTRAAWGWSERRKCIENACMVTFDTLSYKCTMHIHRRLTHTHVRNVRKRSNPEWEILRQMHTVLTILSYDNTSLLDIFTFALGPVSQSKLSSGITEYNSLKWWWIQRTNSCCLGRFDNQIFLLAPKFLEQTKFAAYPDTEPWHLMQPCDASISYTMHNTAQNIYAKYRKFVRWKRNDINTRAAASAGVLIQNLRAEMMMKAKRRKRRKRRISI